MGQPHRIPLVLAICISAAGCFETGAQVDANCLTNEAQTTERTVGVCNDAIANNETYAPIAAKTNVKAGPYSLKMVTDATRPTKKEVELIYQVHTEMQECRKLLLGGAARYHPSVVTVLIDGFAESDALLAQLVTAKLTWGQFNQAMQDLDAKNKAKMTQANAQIASQMANQQQFELDQRQRASTAIQHWAYQQQVLANQQQAINSMNQSRTINCNYVGDTLQCNSL